MKFTHDFQEDLSTLLAELDSGRPFAFNRFADGELAILEGRDIPTADGWSSKVDDRFRERLLAALRYRDDDYYLGLSCPCCAPDDFQKLLALAGRTADDPQVTTSNVFVNGNYDTFLERWPMPCRQPMRLKNMHYLSPLGKNVVNGDYAHQWIDRTVEVMLHGDIERSQPMAIAAGPATKIVIYEYWMQSRRKRTVIDIGSAIDLCGDGAATRSYHDPSHPNRKKICQWVK